MELAAFTYRNDLRRYSGIISHVTDIHNKFVYLSEWPLLELHSFSNIVKLNALYDMT